MTEREMLELAAKAAGIKGKWSYRGSCIVIEGLGVSWKHWRPSVDSGDALELAGALNINLDICYEESIDAWVFDRDTQEIIVHIDEQVAGDKMAAIRLAITKAAAELGKLKEASA